MSAFYANQLIKDSPPKVGDLAASVFMDDFHNYEADNWTVTNSGAATEEITDEAHGVLLLTNAASDNNNCFLQKIGEAFAFSKNAGEVHGAALWFAIKFKVNDATESDIVAGLQITDASPLDATDGIYFRKDDGDAFLDFVVVKDGTETVVTRVADLENDTYVEVGFYFDGATTLLPYVNGEPKQAVSIVNAPDDELMRVSFGIQNGAAAAKTMAIDYVYAAQAR